MNQDGKSVNKTRTSTYNLKLLYNSDMWIKNLVRWN